MNEKTKHFVARRFKAYYTVAAAKIRPPREFWQREWGFVLFDQHYPNKMVMRRHTALATETDFQHYLRENAPVHAYYSTALYTDPTAEMAKKGWLGADLIFDLDADHIVSEAELPRYSYEELLVLVKQETRKLLDFLTADFGFADTEIELVFSGSRGYHIHIATESVRGLGSRERREIVDYLTATGLDILIGKEEATDYAFKELRRCPECNKITPKMICPLCGRSTEKVERKASKEGKDVRLLLSEGWGKRLRKRLSEFFISEMGEISDEEALNKLKKLGIIGDTAKKIVEMTREEGLSKRTERIAEGKLGFLPMQVWAKIINDEKIKLADHVDEPVTADIKRLIRLPGSLHGKSSLRVKPLTVEAFEDFDPLADAVVFTSKPVNICALRDSSITLRGERYTIAKDEIESLPEFAALYFLCRGAAELV